MWRSLDPTYPSNLAILAWSLVAWGVWGWAAGLSIFLAWALTRELDPDHPGSALLAAGLATCWGGYSSGLFLLLLGMRLVSRTPGLPARWLDSLLVIGLAWTRPNAAWIAAAAFFLDATLDKPLRRHLVFGLLALVSMGHSDSLLGAAYAPETGWGLLLCLSFLSLGMSTGPLQSLGDASGAPLSAGRVLAAQLLAVLAALLSVWFWQRMGVYSWWPLWSALFATILWRGASFLWNWRSTGVSRSTLERNFPMEIHGDGTSPSGSGSV